MDAPKYKITNEGWAVIDRDTHLSKWVVEHKRLDFDQSALSQMLPYVDPEKVTLDIGANIGCYAYAFLKKGGYVACYEPNREAYKCLDYNIGNMGKVSIFNTAISDKIESYDINADNDNVGMAYIYPINSSVYTMTVDMMNLPDCGFIKIDVEGYELHVLKGGANTINLFKPVMVIEINDHTLRRTGVDRQEIFEWLTSHNYSYRNIYENLGLQDEQLDIICFPN